MFATRLLTLGIVCTLLAPQLVRAQEKLDLDQVKKLEDQKRLEKAEDDYRVFLRQPKTPVEYWSAMKFEISMGKFDLAGLFLDELLKLKDAKEVDKELVRIENAEGMSSFMRLRQIKRWSDFGPHQAEAEKNVEELMNRLTTALTTYLSDPNRINKFIKQLDAATAEERVFAFAQLNRAREFAVPYLIEALRVNKLGTSLHTRIKNAMLRLDSAIVPAFLEVLKPANPDDAAHELDLRLTLLDIVRQRTDKRAIPYLWHLSAAKQYPEAVRGAARATLASLLQTDAALLPPAKVALTKLAEDYFGHRIKVSDSDVVRIWPWDGKGLALKPAELPEHKAEEFFGLRHAREALDLDPAYVPAQTVLLSLVLERAFEDELDQFLLKPMPAGIRNLLGTIDSDLVLSVLERALDENRVAVILPTVTALGERGDVRAARRNSDGTPRGVLRALSHPDRRVQFVAARALLKMPGPQPQVAALRVVEVLRRFLAADGVARAVAAYVPPAKAEMVRQALKSAGYQLAEARKLPDALDKLHSSADYDLVVLHQLLPATELPHVLSQLRGDPDVGNLPILVIPPRDGVEAAKKAARRYRNVIVVSEAVLTMADELKNTIDTAVKDSQGAKLAAEERKELPKLALDVLWRMARGELTGFDVRPAQEAFWSALRSEDTAVPALEVLGRLPGSDVQQRMAGVVLDPGKGKLRLPAAIELNRHIQKHGLLLPRRQVEEVKAAYRDADDANLKSQLALVLGALRPTAQATGAQLYQYRPEPPAAAAEKAEKKEKEKE